MFPATFVPFVPNSNPNAVGASTPPVKMCVYRATLRTIDSFWKINVNKYVNGKIETMHSKSNT